MLQDRQTRILGKKAKTAVRRRTRCCQSHHPPGNMKTNSDCKIPYLQLLHWDWDIVVGSVEDYNLHNKSALVVAWSTAGSHADGLWFGGFSEHVSGVDISPKRETLV